MVIGNDDEWLFSPFRTIHLVEYSDIDSNPVPLIGTIVCFHNYLGIRVAHWKDGVLKGHIFYYQTL